MKVVMYHYVRPHEEDPPFGYYHLPRSAFRRQLDTLASTYEIPSPTTVLEWLEAGRTPPEDALVLSFDDGLRDHVRWVLPELRERDLWGIFFVCTDPLVRERRLAVHRVHTLLGSYPAADLLASALDIARSRDLIAGTVESSEDMYPDRETPGSVRSFKHLLNEVVPHGALEALLDALESEFPVPTDVGEYYLSPSDLTDVLEAGNLVGAHARTHRVLADLPRADQRREITDGKAALERIVDRRVRLFAYPYGTAPTYTEETTALVGEAGFDAAFTTEPGRVTAANVSGDSLEIPRIDCTELPHGDTAVTFPGGD